LTVEKVQTDFNNMALLKSDSQK